MIASLARTLRRRVGLNCMVFPWCCPALYPRFQVFFEHFKKELGETLSFSPDNTVPALIHEVFPEMLDAIAPGDSAAPAAAAAAPDASGSVGMVSSQAAAVAAVAEGRAAAAMRVLEEMLDQARLAVAKHVGGGAAGAPPPAAAGAARPGPPSAAALALMKPQKVGHAAVAALDAKLASAASAARLAAPAAAAAVRDETPGVSFILRLLDRLLDLELLLRRAGVSAGCGVASSAFFARAFPRLLESRELHGTPRQPLRYLPHLMAVVDAPSEALLAAVRKLKGETMPLGGAAEARAQGRHRSYLAQRAAFLSPAREAAAAGRGAVLVRYLGTVLDVLRADMSAPDKKDRESVRRALSELATLAWKRDPAGAAFVAAAAAAEGGASSAAGAPAPAGAADSAAFALEELAWQMLAGGDSERVQGAVFAGKMRAVGGAILVPLMRVAPRAAAASFFTRRITGLFDILKVAAAQQPPAAAGGGGDGDAAAEAGAEPDSPTTVAEKAKAALAAQKKRDEDASREAAREAAAALVRVMFHRLSKQRLDEGPGAKLPKMTSMLSEKLALQTKRAGLPVREAAYAAFGALVCATQNAADAGKRKFYVKCLDGSLFGEGGWALAVDCSHPVHCKMVLEVRYLYRRALGGGGGGGAAAGGMSRKLMLGSVIEAGSLADTLAGTPPEASPTATTAGGGHGSQGRASGASPPPVSLSKGSASPEVAGGDGGGGGSAVKAGPGDRAAGEGGETATAAQQEAEEEDEEAESAQDSLDASPVLQALVRVLEHLAKVLSADIQSPTTDSGTPPEWLQPVVAAVANRSLHGNARLLHVKALLLLNRRARPLLFEGGDGADDAVTEGQPSQTLVAATQDAPSFSLGGSPGGGGGAGMARAVPRGAPDFSLPAAFAPALVAPLVDALIGDPERGGGRGLHVTLREFCIALLEWDSAWPPEAGHAAAAGGRSSLGGGDRAMGTLLDDGADVDMRDASSAPGAEAEEPGGRRPAAGYSQEHVDALKKLLRWVDALLCQPTAGRTCCWGPWGGRR